MAAHLQLPCPSPPLCTRHAQLSGHLRGAPGGSEAACAPGPACAARSAGCLSGSPASGSGSSGPPAGRHRWVSSRRCICLLGALLADSSCRRANRHGMRHSGAAPGVTILPTHRAPTHSSLRKGPQAGRIQRAEKLPTSPSTELALHTPPLASSCAFQWPSGAQLPAAAGTAQRFPAQAWPAETCQPAPAAPADPWLERPPPVRWQRPWGQASAHQHCHISAAHQASCDPGAARPGPSGGGLPAVLLGLHAHASHRGCGWWAVDLTCAAWGQALPPAAGTAGSSHLSALCGGAMVTFGEKGGRPACGTSGSPICQASTAPPDPLRRKGAGLGVDPAEGRQEHSAVGQSAGKILHGCSCSPPHHFHPRHLTSPTPARCRCRQGLPVVPGAACWQGQERERAHAAEGPAATASPTLAAKAQPRPAPGDGEGPAGHQQLLHVAATGHRLQGSCVLSRLPGCAAAGCPSRVHCGAVGPRSLQAGGHALHLQQGAPARAAW